jgi:uncharacterized OB-fold protein
VSTYPKPLPHLTPSERPFWEAAHRHELRLQRCGTCGIIRYPIAPICPACLALAYTWERLSGRGVVSTWVVVHKVYFAGFAPDVPYNVAQVRLEEGPRLTTNLVEVDNAAIYSGMPVEVVFDDVTETITLPKFRPRGTRAREERP